MLCHPSCSLPDFVHLPSSPSTYDSMYLVCVLLPTSIRDRPSTCSSRKLVRSAHTACHLYCSCGNVHCFSSCVLGHCLLIATISPLLPVLLTASVPIVASCDWDAYALAALLPSNPGVHEWTMCIDFRPSSSDTHLCQDSPALSSEDPSTSAAVPRTNISIISGEMRVIDGRTGEPRV
jgi:hypothetical protein